MAACQNIAANISRVCDEDIGNVAYTKTTVIGTITELVVNDVVFNLMIIVECNIWNF